MYKNDKSKWFKLVGATTVTLGLLAQPISNEYHQAQAKDKEVVKKDPNSNKKKYKSTFEKNTKGGKLEGKSEKILKIADEEKVPALLMASIVANESDWGQSDNVEKLNNPMSVLDKKHGKFQKYKSVDEGLRAGAKVLYKKGIKKGLDTPNEVEKIYAPENDDPTGLNKDWAKKVEKTMKELGAKDKKASS